MLPVREPLAGRALDRQRGARHIVDLEGRAVVMSEIELSEVTMQVGFANLLIFP